MRVTGSTVIVCDTESCGEKSGTKLQIQGGRFLFRGKRNLNGYDGDTYLMYRRIYSPWIKFHRNLHGGEILGDITGAGIFSLNF
jgi:hypothetical protein